MSTSSESESLTQISESGLALICGRWAEGPDRARILSSTSCLTTASRSWKHSMAARELVSRSMLE